MQLLYDGSMNIHKEPATHASNNQIQNLPLARVVIVDDMQQVRRDLQMLLLVSGDIEVVGEACNGKEAVELAKLLQPDVIIMDLEMPVMDGLTAISCIRQLKIPTRIVALSVHTDPRDIERAMAAGADSFVQKGSPYPHLMQAILNQTKEEKK